MAGLKEEKDRAGALDQGREIEENRNCQEKMLFLWESGNWSKCPGLSDPKTMYEKGCSAEEKKQWGKWETNQGDKGIGTIGGKPVLPKLQPVQIKAAKGLPGDRGRI